ncbi:G-protein coupled peptide receptor [Aureococcus anophagefferens]|nr:G-protein coupled peptide receptor [Aureococcus anophagefferens]
MGSGACCSLGCPPAPMGHAASTYEKAQDGEPWDAKPVEFFGGDAGAHFAPVPPQFESVRRRYLAKRSENVLGTEALDEFGEHLLEEECLEIELKSAGTWTRCVVRDTSHCHSVAGGPDPTFMYDADHPGGYLLARTRSGLLAHDTPQHRVRGVEELVRRKGGGAAPKQVLVVFTDGSEAAHVAYVAAKSLLNGPEDTLSVITVESSKAHTKPNFKPKVMRDRYEADLTGFWPRSRWRFITIPKSKVPTKEVVTTFVNDRSKMPCAVRTHPDPTLVLVGFSGRKTSAARDPTVIGQVADLSLRTLFCPTVVAKVAPRPRGRHFVMLVEPAERSVRAAEILGTLLRDDDALTFLHVLAHDALKNAPDTLMRMLSKWKARANFEFVENVDGRAISILDALQNEPRPCFNDVDFVVVATRPKTEPGSVSDHLVRHYHRNIVIIKSVLDEPGRRSSMAGRSGVVAVAADGHTVSKAAPPPPRPRRRKVPRSSDAWNAFAAFDAEELVDPATVANLEGAAGAALRHVALRLGDGEAGRLRARFAVLRAAAGGDAGACAFVDAVDGVVSGGTVLIPGVGPVGARALTPLTRFGRDGGFGPGRRHGDHVRDALNDASNALRVASYGVKGDVASTRAEIAALRDELPSLRGYEPACGAYLAALELLALSESEYSAERAVVEDGTFATFYLEGDAAEAATTQRLGAELGDAYSVALQRFSASSRARDRGAGRRRGRARAPDFGDSDTAGLGVASTSTNPLIAGLNFNFAEWEMRFRRKLAERWSTSGLQPADFVGTWRLTLVDEATQRASPILGGVDVVDGDDGEFVSVEFLDDGVVEALGGPAGAKNKQGKVAAYWEKRKPPRWRVRPGPAHLDTCEFELDVNEERVAFCGYVDRGQRIEARFSRRPIRVSGFAFEKMMTPRRFDADARPSGQFRMSSVTDGGGPGDA